MAAPLWPPPPFFDHGAMGLIEGWATWCEWNVEGGPYERHARASRLAALSFFDLDGEGVFDLYVSAMVQSGLSVEAASNAALYFFQYPGFSYRLHPRRPLV